MLAFDETPRISFDDAVVVALGIAEVAATPLEISLIRGTSVKSGAPVDTLKVPLISITGANASCVSTVPKFLLTVTAPFRFVRPVTETTPAWLITIELFWSELPVWNVMKLGEMNPNPSPPVAILFVVPPSAGTSPDVICR